MHTHTRRNFILDIFKSVLKSITQTQQVLLFLFHNSMQNIWYHEIKQIQSKETKNNNDRHLSTSGKHVHAMNT